MVKSLGKQVRSLRLREAHSTERVNQRAAHTFFLDAWQSVKIPNACSSQSDHDLAADMWLSRTAKHILLMIRYDLLDTI